MQNLDNARGRLRTVFDEIKLEDRHARGARAELLPSTTYDSLIAFLDGKSFRDMRMPTGVSDPEGDELRFVTAPLRTEGKETLMVISVISDGLRVSKRYDLTPVSLLLSDSAGGAVSCTRDENGNLSTPLADGLNSRSMRAARFSES